MRIILITIAIQTVFTYSVLGTTPSLPQKDVDIPKDTTQSLKFTCKWNTGFLSEYKKGPAIFHLLNRAYGSEQIQGSVLKPAGDYKNTGIELGIERYYTDGFYASGRFGARQINEEIKGVFQLSSGAQEQCNIKTQQNFLNMGFGIGYDALTMMELNKEVRVIVYAGLDGRFSMNRRIRGTYGDPANSERQVNYDFLTNSYDSDKLYIDPVLGVTFKVAYLTIEGRMQGFHKDYFNPDDPTYPFEIMDRLKLYSFMVGVSF